MSHNPHRVPNHIIFSYGESGGQLQDFHGRHIGHLPAKLVDASRQRDKYPDGIIRSPEAMKRIGERIAHRYNSSHGEMIEKEKLVMTVALGSAAHPELGEFELLHSVGGSPMVKHLGSGRIWHLRWQDLIDLAVESGVHQERFLKDRKPKEG
ncbi:hypothetical protein PJWF_00107 [Achromobacter phage JWF]|uniref:hypothetical protein n=1 Tax=Achromobacter phage JWF TaxID=1589748 RepID=UPI000588E51E|nr:hypothetical protein AXJ13_gp081 [Achromobacter phage JWF]AJD83000.1 hypothetical protein PJWF_00107 [Achromobacter phage JWF]